MIPKITEITRRETELIRSYGGKVPEANNEFNNLQRDKIAAVYENNGIAFIGKINQNKSIREGLEVKHVFTEYTGQPVYNFDADFVVPIADNEIAEMIVQWNSGVSASLRLIRKITRRIDEIGGAGLIWS